MQGDPESSVDNTPGCGGSRTIGRRTLTGTAGERYHHAGRLNSACERPALPRMDASKVAAQNRAGESLDSDALVPRRWAHATVSSPMNCRSCGYDLRGLDASSRCPECGLDIWATVVHSVDPAASRLPSLRNPRAVGNSLVVLTACMFLGGLLMALPSVSEALRDAAGPGGSPGSAWWARLPGLTWEFALPLIVLGVWGLWALAPPRGAEPHGPVWDDIWRVAVGYAGWLACATMLASITPQFAITQRHSRLVLGLAAGVFAMIGLAGLRGVFRVIGQRTREYRRLKGGRQSIELIMPAIAGAMVGELLTHLSRYEWFPPAWRFSVSTLGQVVLAMSMFMVLIGVAYLVVNAWLIRRALRRPPPAIDEVLLPQMPNDTWLPDRED